MQAQEIVDEVQQPRWTRKALMSKFYPIHEKVLKKENPQVTGFKWAFKTPPAPTAEEVVETIEKERHLSRLLSHNA